MTTLTYIKQAGQGASHLEYFPILIGRFSNAFTTRRSAYSTARRGYND
jgi:hypothetical protein